VGHPTFRATHPRTKLLTLTAGVIALGAALVTLDRTDTHDPTNADRTPRTLVSTQQESDVNPWAAGNAAVRAWLNELAQSELDRMVPTTSTTTP
jgi:hypothetical protein